jgi:16S rRNA (cytosine967-C5)-methyltransferase
VNDAAANVRALAAQALASIVGDGVSLRRAFATYSPKLDDSRDRALLSALLHAGARWWLRLDPALQALLDRPMQKRETAVHALLVLGLVQLEILQLPDYAAVAATVEATRALRRPAFANLANALLRRWLRERAERRVALDANVVTRTAHPRWLVDMLTADWPSQVSAILTANNVEAPLWLRANRRRTTRAELGAMFAAAGVTATSPEDFAVALVLAQSTDVTRLPGYAQGLFSVQDGAAQLAPGLMDLRPGMRVLDACAAPGGKAAHILECADVSLLALDRDPLRLPRMHENFARLGVQAQVIAGDAGDPHAWWDGQPFERILLDAPCSATGVIRRQPDVKLHRRATDIAALVAEQSRLLEALWPLLGRGGRLVYATCSVLSGENGSQVAQFLSRHADAEVRPVPVGWHRARAGVQNLPGEGDMDGFFYAIVEKSH